MNQTRIKCPYCGEEIASTAKKCRFCGEWLPALGGTIQPQPAQRHEPQPQKQSASAAPQQQIQQPECQPQPQILHHDPIRQPDNQDTTHSLNDAPESVTSTLPSFFEEYFVKPYIRQYADFKSCTGRRAFWLSMLTLLIVNAGITGLVMLIVGLGGMSMGILLAAGIICGLWSLASIVPSIAIGCRRLRDAGKSPLLYLMSLIPLVGPIILLVLWCKKSRYDHLDENAAFKPIDIVIAGVCIILLAGGIISLGKGVGNMLGGMNDYEAEYYSDKDSEIEGYLVDTIYDNNDTIESLGNDYAESQMMQEDYNEFGFNNGMNYLDGNMISKQGKKFPFKLQFSYDSSTGEISNVIYHNVNYGVTIKLIGYENSEGDIVLEGKDGQKPFMIKFSGVSTYAGDAWSGDFHMNVELFKQ